MLNITEKHRGKQINNKYKGYELIVAKTIFDSGLVQWYFQVNDSDANDHYFHKRTAKESEKLYIDSLITNKNVSSEHIGKHSH